MYSSTVSTVFLIAFAIIAVDVVIRIVRRGSQEKKVPPPGGPVRILRVLVNVAALASLAAIALTGFSVLFQPDPVMTGDRLIFHVSSAPAFAVSAVVLAIFWAHRNRFVSEDGSRLVSLGGWAVPLRKLFFWMAITLTIPSFVSIILAMYPLFSPDEQKNLFAIHRYCAPFLAASGLLFGYFALVSWRERSGD